MGLLARSQKERNDLQFQPRCERKSVHDLKKNKRKKNKSPRLQSPVPVVVGAFEMNRAFNETYYKNLISS